MANLDKVPKKYVVTPPTLKDLETFGVNDRLTSKRPINGAYGIGEEYVVVDAVVEGDTTPVVPPPETELEVPPPPLVSPTSIVGQLDDFVQTANDAGIPDLDGIFSYRVVYESSGTGLISDPSPVSESVDIRGPAHRASAVAIPAPSDVRVDTRKLYRTLNEGTSEWFLVETFKQPIGTGFVPFGYVDFLSDSILSTREQLEIPDFAGPISPPKPPVATVIKEEFVTILAGNSLPNGAYTYKIAFIDEDDNIIPSIQSNLVTPGFEEVILTQIAVSPDPRVVEKRIYRTLSVTPSTIDVDTNNVTELGGNKWYLVATILNAEVTFSDKLGDDWFLKTGIGESGVDQTGQSNQGFEMFDPPETIPTVAPTPNPGDLLGFYKYTVSFFNTDTGVESTPPLDDSSPDGYLSSPVTLTFSEMELTNIPISDDPRVNARRIYRTINLSPPPPIPSQVAATELFFLLDTIEDNTTTTYLDTTGDFDMLTTDTGALFGPQQLAFTSPFMGIEFTDPKEQGFDYTGTYSWRYTFYSATHTNERGINLESAASPTVTYEILSPSWPLYRNLPGPLAELIPDTRITHVRVYRSISSTISGTNHLGPPFSNPAVTDGAGASVTAINTGNTVPGHTKWFLESEIDITTIPASGDVGSTTDTKDDLEALGLVINGNDQFIRQSEGRDFADNGSDLDANGKLIGILTDSTGSPALTSFLDGEVIQNGTQYDFVNIDFSILNFDAINGVQGNAMIRPVLTPLKPTEITSNEFITETPPVPGESEVTTFEVAGRTFYRRVSLKPIFPRFVDNIVTFNNITFPESAKGKATLEGSRVKEHFNTKTNQHPRYKRDDDGAVFGTNVGGGPLG